MNESLFNAELDYQVASFISASLLRSGFLSDEELIQVKTLLLEKYHPVLGSLFAEVG